MSRTLEIQAREKLQRLGFANVVFQPPTQLGGREILPYTSSTPLYDAPVVVISGDNVSLLPWDFDGADG